MFSAMDVKTLCLGVLSRGAASGYEIKKQCEEGPFAHFYAAGFGSIYPALNSLLNDRLISLGRFAPRPIGEGGPTEDLPDHQFGGRFSRKQRERMADYEDTPPEVYNK